MRIRLPVGRSVFFLAALMLCLTALFPLRLALDWLAMSDRGMTAREARGTIWFGVLAETQLGPVRMGDANVRLRMLPLLLGRARLDLGRPDETQPLALGLDIERHGFGVHDAGGRLATDPGALPLPVLAVDLTDVSVQFRDGLCVHAEGLVATRMGGDVAGIALPPTMTGTARCAGGALQIPLVGQSGMERIDLRIAGDGSYRAEVSLKPSDEAMRARLNASGIRPSASGYALVLGGTL